MKPVNLIFLPARDPAPALLTLLLTAVIMVSATPNRGCADELIALSPCLPYVASPPNNLSSSVSSLCCDLFSSAFDSGGAACLCYLLRQPLFLGFPLNTTRILALSSLCPSKNVSSTTTTSLQSLCEGSPTLPPLQSTTGSENSPAPLMSLPLESPMRSPTPMSSLPEPQPNSSALVPVINSCCCLQPAIMLFFVPIFTYL